MTMFPERFSVCGFQTPFKILILIYVYVIAVVVTSIFWDVILTIQVWDASEETAEHVVEEINTRSTGKVSRIVPLFGMLFLGVTRISISFVEPTLMIPVGLVNWMSVNEL